MNLETLGSIVRWLGGLLAYLTLGAVFYGIWRGTHRQAGRITDRLTLDVDAGFQRPAYVVRVTILNHGTDSFSINGVTFRKGEALGQSEWVTVSVPVTGVRVTGTEDVVISANGDYEQLAYQSDDQYVVEIQPARKAQAWPRRSSATRSAASACAR